MKLKLRWISLLALLAFLAAVFVTSVYEELGRRRRAEQSRSEALEALRRAEDYYSRLHEQVEFFKTDEGKAWLAREKLNMAYPGEEIYKLEGDGRQSPSENKKH